MQPLLSKEAARRLAEERQQTALYATRYLQTLPYQDLHKLATGLDFDPEQVSVARTKGLLIDLLMAGSLDHEAKEWADRYEGDVEEL